jgi:hypothetical protein
VALVVVVLTPVIAEQIVVYVVAKVMALQDKDFQEAQACALIHHQTMHT